jgi:hypothetical protein
LEEDVANFSNKIFSFSDAIPPAMVSNLEQSFLDICDSGVSNALEVLVPNYFVIWVIQVVDSASMDMELLCPFFLR